MSAHVQLGAEDRRLSLAGGALSWAFVPGGTWLPAIGIRASYTKMFGVDQLDF